MEQPVVSLSSGAVRGRTVDRVSAFLGIPYAAPPFGPHRFAAPQPVAPWDGVRDATAYGPTVPKGDYPAAVQQLLPEVTIPGEECLNLNVWTPADADRLPVLVWVHGGSYVQGSGSLAEYDGTAFARDGVVCVTLNYRLGAEGFVQLDGAPANRGLLDVVAALQWVRDEIAAFGGDPARVTVAGESAGGHVVTALLAMPAARGLFARAVVASGDAENVLTPQRAQLVAARFAGMLAAPVREVPVAELAAAASELTNQRIGPVEFPDWGDDGLRLLPFQPTVDGEVLPAPPLSALPATDVPVLVGTTRDEFRLFLPPALLADLDEEGLAAAVRPYGLSGAGLAAYRAAHATPGDTLVAVATDWRFARAAVRIAEAVPRAWVYRFDGIDPATNGGLGACHAADVPFFFDTTGEPSLAARLGAHPSRRAAATAHGAWVRFATEGDPGWAPYTPASRTTGLLADTLDVVDDPAGDLRRTWAATDA